MPDAHVAELQVQRCLVRAGSASPLTQAYWEVYGSCPLGRRDGLVARMSGHRRTLDRWLLTRFPVGGETYADRLSLQEAARSTLSASGRCLGAALFSLLLSVQVLSREG